MTRSEALEIASEAMNHPKIGTVKLVEDLAPSASGSYLLLALRYPHRLDGMTTFTIANHARWAWMQEALA